MKKICRKCMGRVHREHDPELGKAYPYYCPRCNENMYSFECMDILHDGMLKTQSKSYGKIETVIL